jgi:hypothetical protein
MLCALVEFAAAHSLADLSAVHINVKNCSSAYAGMAYYGVPLISSAHGSDAKHLVTLRIGSHWRFPKASRPRERMADRREPVSQRVTHWTLKKVPAAPRSFGAVDRRSGASRRLTIGLHYAAGDEGSKHCRRRAPRRRRRLRAMTLTGKSRFDPRNPA